jgi:uncharacterized protein
MVTTIGLEEHAWTPDLRDALTALEGDARDDSVTMLNNGEIARRLLDVTSERIQHMDDAGIDVQVLSVTTPGTQSLPPAEAVRLARDANDMLAATVSAQPGRFAAFATLPTPDPAAAAKELERTVRGLGFAGAMLFPRTGDVYLDHDRFRPVFEAAAGLGMPLYIHPEIAPHPIRDVYFSGYSDDINLILATGGWGWHADAGIAALRLILAGTFDRHPDLQLILGHWGEMLVFFLERADILSNWTPHLQRRVAEYITGNLNVTPSGIFSHRMLAHALAAIGADRIMFSSDYPFQYSPNGGARAFLDTAPISPEDKAKIGYQNAERILGLRRTRPGSDRIA